MVDQFIKWLENVPLIDQSAEKVAMMAIDNFFCTFGMSLAMHMDQGTNFVGNILKPYVISLKLIKLRLLLITPRVIVKSIIIEMIRCLKVKSEKRLGCLFATYNKCSSVSGKSINRLIGK